MLSLSRYDKQVVNTEPGGSDMSAPDGIVRIDRPPACAAARPGNYALGSRSDVREQNDANSARPAMWASAHLRILTGFPEGLDPVILPRDAYAQAGRAKRARVGA
jgi:hypothetical protein